MPKTFSKLRSKEFTARVWPLGFESCIRGQTVVIPKFHIQNRGKNHITLLHQAGSHSSHTSYSVLSFLLFFLSISVLWL